jgi:hypothetical protein
LRIKVLISLLAPVRKGAKMAGYEGCQTGLWA